MSWVANVMISVALPDAKLLPELRDWLEREAPRRDESGRDELDLPRKTGVGSIKDQTSNEVTTWGGPKWPECTVWAGTLDHGDVDAVVGKVFEMPWVAPAAVQLMICDQEQSYFRLWMVRDGEVRQYAPEPPPEPGDEGVMAWAH